MGDQGENVGFEDARIMLGKLIWRAHAGEIIYLTFHRKRVAAIVRTCGVCGLIDPYDDGCGDGIRFCDCARCDCGNAAGSSLCVCPNDASEEGRRRTGYAARDPHQHRPPSE